MKKQNNGYNNRYWERSPNASDGGVWLHSFLTIFYKIGKQ